MKAAVITRSERERRRNESNGGVFSLEGTCMAGADHSSSGAGAAGGGAGMPAAVRQRDRPYPFGIGSERCYRGGVRGFASTATTPDARRASSCRLRPRGDLHLLAAAEVTVLLNASRACYGGGDYGRGRRGREEQPMSLNGSAFLFSSMKSKFVAIGCPGLAYFVDDGGDYVTGCMSVCRPSARALPGSCRATTAAARATSRSGSPPTGRASAASAAARAAPSCQRHRLRLRFHGGRMVVLVRRLKLQPDGRLRRARRAGLGHPAGRRERERERELRRRKPHAAAVVRLPERAQRLHRLQQRPWVYLQLHRRVPRQPVRRRRLHRSKSNFWLLLRFRI